MYKITTKSEFDSAHFLKGYEGKCANIHGHRWTVEVEIMSEGLIEEGQYRGMITDFSVIKDSLKEMTDNMDHSFIFEEGSLKETTVAALKDEGFRMIEVPFRPTAENFSKYFYDELKKKGYPMSYVTVYETPNNKATYSE